MVTLTNVIIWCCTPAVLNDERGSLRSRSAAAVSSLTLRQISGVLPPEQAWALWLSRQIVARVMDAFGPPLAGTRVVPVDTRTSDGRRVVGEWVHGAGVPHHHADTAIYFVHGSGYALCSPRTHRQLVSWLSRLTGLPVFSVDYRLAPRHRFPTAADDVRSGWDWLIGDYGLAPKRTVVAGDSAGGHLSVDLLLQPDVVQPSALVLLSPVADLTFTLARTRERLRRDRQSALAMPSAFSSCIARKWPVDRAPQVDVEHPRPTSRRPRRSAPHPAWRHTIRPPRRATTSARQACCRCPRLWPQNCQAPASRSPCCVRRSSRRESSNPAASPSNPLN